jgi:hypothetical protein
LIASQEPVWLQARQDQYTVALALGYALPEKPLTAAEKKRLKKRSDEIILDAITKLARGGEVDDGMRGLIVIWAEQRKRGRGRPNKKIIQEGMIIQAADEEYRKHHQQYEKAQKILDDIYRQTGLRISITGQPLHKQILGKISDRTGLGTERLKQISKSPTAEINRIVKRLARESGGK